jgi:hypothetical protein
MVNIIGGGTRALLRIENNNSVGSPGIIFGEGGVFTEDTNPTVKKVQGTNNLAIMCGGNVGIGTASPQATFHVSSSSSYTNSYIQNASGTTDGNIWGFGPNGQTLYYFLVNDSINFTRNYMQVTRSGTTLSSICLAPGGQGNVGIGTTSPGSPLHVYKSQNATTELRVENPNTGTGAVSQISFLTNDASGTGGRGGLAVFNSTYTAAGQYRPSGTYLYNNGIGGVTIASEAAQPIYFATSATERMRITSGGNVGIGVTNPSSALHFGTPVANKIIALYDSLNSAASTATDFYGFGINGGTLRYNTDSTSSVHRFYCGATLAATIAETTATFNGRVVTPNVYYIMGYLAGGTTAGNYISLGVQQSSGGMAVTSSNKLVAPISGLYHFGFNTIMNATTGRNDVYINVNGGAIVNTLNEDNGSGYHYRSGMITYYLNANDFVQFYCASGTIFNAFTVDAWHTYFFYHVG